MHLYICIGFEFQITFEEFYVFLFPDHTLGQVSATAASLKPYFSLC